MFFTNALSAYIDQLYDLSFSLSDNFTLLVFLKHLFIYFINSIKLFLMYIISFNWLNDFVELPCTFRESYSTIFEGRNVLDTILETKISPSSFSFSSLKPINSNHFGTGLLNSFFFTLPLSVPHLLTIRVFLLNGIPAALFAAGGTILGQFCFLTCVLFGLESILIPFLNLQPFIYIGTLVILVNMIYNLVHFPKLYGINKTQKDFLVPLFGLNFLLAWTEHTSLFQYFSNLTVNSLPTILQNNYEFSSVLPNLTYLSGLLLGTVIWTFLFGKVVMGFRNWIAGVFLIPFTYLNEKIHYLTLVMIFTFCLTSVPYYGFEYFMVRPLGFLSQDYSLPILQPYPAFVIREGDFPLLFNSSPFDRTDGLTHLNYNYEDFSFEPFKYWNNRNNLYLANTGSDLKVSMSSSPLDEKSQSKLKVKKDLITDLYFDPALETIKTNEKIQNKEVSRLEKRVDLIARRLFKTTGYDYFENNRLNDTNLIIEFQEFFKKYYNNPIYKALTRLEINSFLLGQPKYQNLTTADEIDLYHRRVIFENYLDSIEEYKSFVTPNKRVFGERIYNQQFKGTFDLVSQYFSIEIPSTLSEETRVMKAKADLSSGVSDQTVFPLQEAKSGKAVLKFDQPLYNEILRDFNPLLHEELRNPPQESKRMSMIDSTPFYIGWDTNLRKFLVKAPYIKTNMGTTVVDKPLPNTFSWSLKAWSNKEKNVSKKLDSSKPGLLIPYTELAPETKLNLVNYLNSTLESNQKSTLVKVPPNLPSYNWDALSSDGIASLKRRLNLTSFNIGTTLPPRFGGFTWSGSKISLLEKDISTFIERFKK